MKGWRPRWFFVSVNGGRGVRTTQKFPTKSVEPKLDGSTEDRVKKDPAKEELEVQRKAEKEEERRLFARADKYKEAKLGPAPKPTARERVRPRPKPLGEKDLSGFEPRPPPVDPLKEKSKKEVEAVLKKKKRVREREEGPALKMMKEVMVEETPKVGLEGAAKEMESEATGLEKQVEGETTSPEEGAEQQPKGGPAPQGE
ncbi:uncharacterized protein LOC114293113 [Camellia sinensis]|uniref:uncharacterized protein LOC114293113 n=1 Tax=Camellia sinensis TaxID=4442 RepID=UPI00103618DF|nr:uncharacterized protein LOC114293113 [Camellia sinensis]